MNVFLILLALAVGIALGAYTTLHYVAYLLASAVSKGNAYLRLKTGEWYPSDPFLRRPE